MKAQPGDSIQAAIDAVARAGGGVVLLASGTHVIVKPLRVPPGVTLQGAS